ncbi:hypothetical protein PAPPERLAPAPP_05280 [Brevundimonas phage vB_BpoS-Papperlapapp]|uniref:Uncharacterized protein n=2 Tax=Marchewkavirus TaxID=3425052 RepID=A0A9E7SJB1_9CAUD|nr:hypothetical protein KABACHOK_03650 [Brevundimonas phage vB_BpoS-Kabachok]USN14893.1 hypothetical protein DOMOVOI_04220 [Brevundimonas phage vB_BpoS-Domovoi]USN16266.1 hypothetical protein PAPPERLAPAPP_05280 [Brevundimonas phage vB_BpoS-Papperlapapp]
MSPGFLGMGREDASGRPYASAADVPVVVGGGEAAVSTLGGGSAVPRDVYRGGPGDAAAAGGGTIPQNWVVSVYIDDGLVYEYDLPSMPAAREHVSAIIATGYRSVQTNQPHVLVHYPPHRITKVKITAPSPIHTAYPDRVRGA